MKSFGETALHTVNVTINSFETLAITHFPVSASVSLHAFCFHNLFALIVAHCQQLHQLSMAKKWTLTLESVINWPR